MHSNTYHYLSMEKWNLFFLSALAGGLLRFSAFLAKKRKLAPRMA